MSIITVTTQVSEKNTRTVTTQKGQKQVVSSPIVKDSTGKWVYASAFVNFEVRTGDVLTISGRIEQTEDGEYKNNSFVFPTVERLYQQQPQTQQQSPDFGRDSNPFSSATPLNIDDDALPF